MVLLCLLSDAARADEAPDPRFELTTGVDATADSRFAHVSLVWALGTSLYTPGWRMRVAGGYGSYQYSGVLVGPVLFGGNARLAEAMLGYQWRRGELFIKAYAGGQFVDHAITPADPGNAVSGSATGAKVLVETWWTMRPRLWLSADASYATPFEDYWSQVRLGWRLGPGWVGAEVAAMGNKEYDAQRLGGFYRLGFGRLEITASGGLSGDYVDRDMSFYAAVSVGRKF